MSRAQPGRIGNVTGQNYAVSRRNYFGKVRGGFILWRYQSAFSGDWVTVLYDHATPDTPYRGAPTPKRTNIHALAHYVRDGI